MVGDVQVSCIIYGDACRRKDRRAGGRPPVAERQVIAAIARSRCDCPGIVHATYAVIARVGRDKASDSIHSPDAAVPKVRDQDIAG